MSDGPALVECAPGVPPAAAATPQPAEPLAVIEISEDGSWETKPLTAEELNAAAAAAQEDGCVDDDVQPDFLATRGEGKLESVKIKHVTRAHSSQYYVNCPVASVRPMVQEVPPSPKGTNVAAVVGETHLVNGGGEGTVKVVDGSHIESGALVNGGGLNGDALSGDFGCTEEEEEQSVSVLTEGAVVGCGEEKQVAAEEVLVTPEGVVGEDGGVVVTDSIIENKEKTKNYWEEKMLAAVASGASSPPRLRPSMGSEDGSEASPVAQGPKIVETVAKQSEGAAVVDDEGVEEEEEEVGGVVVGEEAIRSSRVETPAELKIAMELREMREREEELRQLRQALGLTRASDDVDEVEGLGVSRDDSALHSIPTTDEGNVSECGTEEKDGSEDKHGRNDTMSPDMPSLESPHENGTYAHRRTQSMDSTSSGHSSASGGQRIAIEYPPRRRVIVKPFTSAEEDQNFRENEFKDENTMNLENRQNSTPFRGLKETPIEREIRIAREREEELRREKGLIQPSNQSPVTRPEVAPRSPVPPVTSMGKGPQSVQLRLATSRIQREIQETTEREKELREAGKIQTMSEDTVDSKVTRIGERMGGGGAKFDKKLHKSVSAFEMGDLSPSLIEEDKPTPPVTPPVVPPKPQDNTPNFPLSRSVSMITGLSMGSGSSGFSVSGNSPFTPTQPRFTPTSGHKGLMERFLASRGKMTFISPFSNSSASSSSPSSVQTQSPSSLSSSVKNVHSQMRPVSPVVKNVSNIVPVVHKPLEIVTDNRQVEQEENGGVAEGGMHRRGWTSAEEKIQEELKEMRMREDELRLQRARIMAQSQPNLLSIMDENDEGSQWNEDDSKLSSLYSTLSNPSLLDLDGDSPVREVDLAQEQTGQKSTRRKKSSLIAHWENRIQQNN
ncbi:uncharacterized protein LOC124171805 isoform X2 [Ischnura elegans]|uniref:uncharacterized protein LOC124171805 isoform X2 n=1 Tax=Ischnura elegans TaxID=197161 RepID=UPI001ED8B2EB|nr:uncharacterized protein LOC124171805 isoform X2 [Ischnura elegans]